MKLKLLKTGSLSLGQSVSSRLYCRALSQSLNWGWLLFFRNVTHSRAISNALSLLLLFAACVACVFAVARVAALLTALETDTITVFSTYNISISTVICIYTAVVLTTGFV